MLYIQTLVATSHAQDKGDKSSVSTQKGKKYKAQDLKKSNLLRIKRPHKASLGVESLKESLYFTRKRIGVVLDIIKDILNKSAQIKTLCPRK